MIETVQWSGVDWTPVLSGALGDVLDPPPPPVDSFVIGVTKPNSSNTGVGIIGAAPTDVHTGDYTTTFDGEVIKDLIITGRLIVRHANCRAENYEVLGGTAVSQATAFLVDTTRAVNFTSRFGSIHAVTSNVYATGMGPNNFTSERDHIYDVVDPYDLFHSTGGKVNVTILAPYGHRQLRITPDPNHASSDNRTHPDGIQFMGGDGGYVKGANFEARASTTLSTPSLLVGHPQGLSALMFTPITGPIKNVVVEDCWLSGGEITVNAGADQNSTTTATIRRCQFGRDQYLSNAVIVLDPTATGIDVGTGNVYEDDGSPVPINRRG